MRSRRGVRWLLALAALALFSSCGDNGGGGGGGGGSQTQGAWHALSGGNGQAWNLTISHSGGTFKAENLTANLSYNGTSTVAPSGFVENRTTGSTDNTVTLPAIGHSIDLSGIFALLKLSDTKNAVPLVNTGAQCPQLSGGLNLNRIHAFQATLNANTDTAYETLTMTQSGSNYTFTNNNLFRLDGTSNGTGGGSFTCSAGLLTPTVVGSSGAAFSTNKTIGLGDLGAGGSLGSIFFATPAAPVDIPTLVAGSYTAMTFKGTTSQQVGFGPGAGSSISGGAFASLSSSAFNTHATDITLSFTGQPSTGLLICTVNDINGLHSPCIAAVTTVNSKFQIFVFTIDLSATEPYQIYLSQM